MLTNNQIAIMTGQKKRVDWTCEEIARGFALSYFNRRGYNYVVNKLLYPLPAVRSLQEWSEDMLLLPGVVLKDSLVVLKALSTTLSEGERQVVVSFDEMKCKALYEYDKTLDRIFGPNDQMQCVIVRGLFAKFKQPIYINFDEKMTPDLLNDLIVKLHEVNLNVVAFVGDNGGGNVGLWTNCDVNFNETTIKHPVTGEDIFMFSDVPHLLKLLRNWFIDGGFQLQDKTILNKSKIRQNIENNPEISPVFKLTLHHITLIGSDRQNVRVASQLFSHSVAQYLLKHFPDDQQVEKLSKFIDLVNKWFDICNSYTFYTCGYKKPYGADLKDQDSVLDEMYDTVKKMKCFNKKGELQNSMQIFQKGILMSITSLKLLRSKMNEKFGFNYILTHRLNQDCLENFFSQVRGRSGQHDHPSPVECLQRIKVIMLGENPGVALHNHSNTIEQDAEEYVSATFMKALHSNDSSDSPVKFLDEAVMENNEMPNDLHSNGSADWTVEFLDEAVMENDEMQNDLHSNDSTDARVEFLEEISMEMNDLHSNGSTDRRVEFLEIDQVSDESLAYGSGTKPIEFIDYFLNDINTELIEDKDPFECHDEGYFQVPDEFIKDLENEMPVDALSKRMEKTKEDGVEYIAGWLAFKLKEKNLDYTVSRRLKLPSHVTDHTYAQYIGTPSNSWIDALTYGGLTKPSEQLRQWVERLEKEFIRIHGDEFGERCNAMRGLISTFESDCPLVPLEVIKVYSKFRIYARCRFLNKKRLEAAILQRIENRRIRAMAAAKRSHEAISDDLSRSKNKKMKKIIN